MKRRRRKMGEKGIVFTFFANNEHGDVEYDKKEN